MCIRDRLPEEAEKVVDGDTITVPITELAVGDVVLGRVSLIGDEARGRLVG